MDNTLFKKIYGIRIPQVISNVNMYFIDKSF
jgi:hypothetical protein